MSDLIPDERIISHVVVLRGEKVMLDRDLAELYGVETKYLKRQVRRNITRFPSDFMFEMNEQELENWRGQFGTSNSGDKMGLRYSPMVFTEHGILMLSTVLKSDQAIQTNITIIRVFNRMRKMLESNQAMMEKLNIIEQHVLQNSKNIQELRFELKKMMSHDIEQEEKKGTIGFRLPGDKG